MRLLSMVEAELPPGFRFHPRDEELVCDYLMKKVMMMGMNGNGSSTYTSQGFPLLMEVDLNNCEPWDLPEAASVGGKEWYFYSQLDRKYATGLRTNRATEAGYWKATGKDKRITRKGILVGMKKTLVFYQGRAPKGRKTNWVMHEHRIEGSFQPTKHSLQEDWVLCRVFCKSKNKKISIKSMNLGQENYYCDKDPSSSPSLPPLTSNDSPNYITFDPTPNNPNGLTQVPCFSIPTASPHQIIPATTDHPGNLNGLWGGLKMASMPQFDAIDPLGCDSKVMKLVLEHLTKLEDKRKENLSLTSSFGECSSSGNQLPVMGFPTMINY